MLGRDNWRANVLILSRMVPSLATLLNIQGSIFLCLSVNANRASSPSRYMALIASMSGLHLAMSFSETDRKGRGTSCHNRAASSSSFTASLTVVFTPGCFIASPNSDFVAGASCFFFFFASLSSLSLSASPDFIFSRNFSYGPFTSSFWAFALPPSSSLSSLSSSSNSPALSSSTTPSPSSLVSSSHPSGKSRSSSPEMSPSFSSPSKSKPAFNLLNTLLARESFWNSLSSSSSSSSSWDLLFFFFEGFLLFLGCTFPILRTMRDEKK
mmetsp:Transcript_152484/g.266185  ORF Transcript_152484/g.266185 Transcript_152484/m.266185 type:complete len:268 (+) Transcript_152484:2924-3727(+)